MHAVSTGGRKPLGDIVGDMQCNFHLPKFSTRIRIDGDGHALRRSAVWRSASKSSELYRSGGTPRFAAKSMKAANGVSHSSAARPSCLKSRNTPRAYPKLIHYNKLDKGGHPAAWEQPKLFSEEVRAGFRSLR
jgi:hypothetical protein